MKNHFLLRSLLLKGSLLVLTLSFYNPAFSQNFPPYNFKITDSAATEGYYFMSPYRNVAPYTYDCGNLILDRYGRMIFYRNLRNPGYTVSAVDFKIQPDGRMSYFDLPRSKFIFMDSTFNETDSIACTSDIETDQHDIQVLSNGHYLIFGTEIRIMNLTSYHWFGFNHQQPGSANAEVGGVVIQEFDENKNLVWEWKAHDHYQFDDVDQRWLFSPTKVDWTHANAVEQDNDGNILLSLRHFNEITKINHTTGDIIWRFGGKQNDFTFQNDPVGFTGQHDIRRVSDTSVSLFDNGQLDVPQRARAVEYSLDETNKIARLVWEYIYDNALYSKACGNHQYTENGNHLVDFGFTGSTKPWMVVVKQDESKVAEITMPVGYSSYRAFNYVTLPWQLYRPAVRCEKTGNEYFLVAEDGHEQYKWSTGETTQSIKISDTGNYWVFVPYGVGYLCSEFMRVDDPLNPCPVTAVEETRNPDYFSISPNPAHDKATINFNLEKNSEVKIIVESLTGKEIIPAYKVNCTTGSNSFTINLSGLSSGIYIVNLITGRNIFREKIIVIN